MAPRSDLPKTSLLSPGGYDDDATSVRSLSEQDSDSEDDQVLRNKRSTLELAEHDRTVLEEEEELEKLLTRRGPADGLRRMFSPNRASVRIGKKHRTRRRRRPRSERRDGHRRRKEWNDEGEIMFEMEEGYRDDDSSLLSTPQSGSDSDGFEEVDDYTYPASTPVSWRRSALIFAAVVVIFLILLLGAYKASTGFRAAHHNPRTLLSNGTALFAPTTILISLDGFRADFLTRGLTPTLNAFIADGVSPPYMLPSFPSVTFPNHFTMVTGLYPESHGIVGNTFWDPMLQEEFYYTHPSASMQPKWWNAEPLWVTAELQGVSTAIHMWPGSEAHIGPVEPSFLDKYNGSEALSRKVDRIVGLLDLPGEEADTIKELKRPQMIAAYVPNVDANGHKFGPNSTEIRSTIQAVDDMLAGVFSGLEQRNLTEIVNVVIVSDHGMATTSTQRLVQLDDLIDMELVERIDGWPSRGIRPKRPEDLRTLQNQLAKSAANLSHAIEVYTRESMPERYHFSRNDRIAPLWVIPKAGWAIVERADFDVQEALATSKAYYPRGIHGYDHEHPLMRAIFIARGPAFPHTPNSRVEVFQNIEVYNILCDSLGIEPLPNNGTLRLPFQVVGSHSDDQAPTSETPSDPPIAAEPEPVSSDPAPADDTAPTMPAASDGDRSGENQNDQKDEHRPWWSSVLDKLQELKEWASQLFEAERDNHPGR